MSLSHPRIEKIREATNLNSITYNMYTTTVYETHNLVLPAAKYTVITHSPSSTQLLRHKLDSSTPVPKFAVKLSTVVKPRERSVLITRQYRLLNSSRLEITYVITKHELDHFEIEWQNKDEYTCELADDSEKTKLLSIKEYGDEEREKEAGLAKDAGIFYLALLAHQKEVQDREDADEWVVVKRDDTLRERTPDWEEISESEIP